jgi:hypothetical protein
VTPCRFAASRQWDARPVQRLSSHSSPSGAAHRFKRCCAICGPLICHIRMKCGGIEHRQGRVLRKFPTTRWAERFRLLPFAGRSNSRDTHSSRRCSMPTTVRGWGDRRVAVHGRLGTPRLRWLSWRRFKATSEMQRPFALLGERPPRLGWQRSSTMEELRLKAVDYGSYLGNGRARKATVSAQNLCETEVIWLMFRKPIESLHIFVEFIN